MSQIIYKEDDDLFFPVFFGGFSMMAEGVTGVTTSDLTVRACVHSGSPSLTDITSDVTLHELSSSNKPGMYLVEIDTSDATGTGWDAGNEISIFIENDNSPPDWREPPVFTIVCAPHDAAAIPEGIWEHDLSGYDDHTNRQVWGSNEKAGDRLYNAAAFIWDIPSSERNYSGPASFGFLINTTMTLGIDTLNTKIDIIDGIVDAILVDTGTTLPATLTTIESKIDTIDGVVDDILVDTGTTIPATLTSIESKVDIIDGVVDDILVDTGTTIPATLTSIESKIDIIDSVVDDILVDTGVTLPATLSTIEGKIDIIDGIVDAILEDTGTTLPLQINLLQSNLATIGAEVTTILDTVLDMSPFIDVAISSRASQLSVDDIQATIDGVDVIVSSLMAPEIIYIGGFGSDQTYRFGIQIDNAWDGAQISAGNISADKFVVDLHREGSGGWTRIYDSDTNVTIFTATNLVYVDVPFSEDDTWMAGDSFRWAFYGVTAVVGGDTYYIGHPSSLENYRYGKVLADPGTGGGGGGLTADDVWNLDISNFNNERTAGGTVNITKRLVFKIRRMVRKIAEALGINLGADR